MKKDVEVTVDCIDILNRKPLKSALCSLAELQP